MNSRSPAISPLRTARRISCAFTLVEMMVASAILTVILLMIFGITQQTSEAWKNSAAKIESFQGARAAFESMSRRISQATLNTYYDYFADSGEKRTSQNAATFVPRKYGRYSDLHFVTGKNLLPGQVTHSIFFQAPVGYSDDQTYQGVENTLNATGYYIQYAADPAIPAFLENLASYANERKRFRLMQFTQPTQDLGVYTNAGGSPTAWFTDPLSVSASPSAQLAENIVALIIHPKRPRLDAGDDLAPDYEYDTRVTWTGGKQPVTQHQLPPVVEIVLVAVDEPSFSRIQSDAEAQRFVSSDLFQRAEDLDAEGGSDLEKLEAILSAAPNNLTGNKSRLKYRTFRGEVPVRAAKWSE